MNENKETQRRRSKLKTGGVDPHEQDKLATAGKTENVKINR